jgi:hypothetical protein
MNIDLKLKNIEIDNETADRIIVVEMLDQYSILKQEIKKQKTIENPLDSQREDLEYNEKFLEAVKTMLKHYIAHSEWPEELKNENEYA